MICNAFKQFLCSQIPDKTWLDYNVGNAGRHQREQDALLFPAPVIRTAESDFIWNVYSKRADCIKYMQYGNGVDTEYGGKLLFTTNIL